MEIKLDKTGTTSFFEWVAKKFLEISLPYIERAIENTYSDDELLTKQELCERILKCDVKTAEKYFIFADDFPFIEQGESRKYPKRKVEEWIKQNTKYN